MVHPSQHSEGELTAAELEAGRLLFAGSCDFIAAANNMHVLPPEGLPEICFAGRSNVGKSSLINALTGRKALARTSQTPGARASLFSSTWRAGCSLSIFRAMAMPRRRRPISRPGQR